MATLSTRRLLSTLAVVVTAVLSASSYNPHTHEKRVKPDAIHLLLDGSLSDEEVAKSPFTYNSFQEAITHVGDSVTIYILPYVYWIDNPDTPAVVAGKGGREPFGMTIEAKKLHLVGLGHNPSDVVLASQRGQTQGAIGNFTMFDFHVDTLTVENLTMGNYCNVDLNYELIPELSRPKRSDAITQAHIGYVKGQMLTARRVNFISRLNLNPLTGAESSYYEDCHFECTDDAMNGNAVYRHCSIDLYGQKPFWSTYKQGAMFVDCDFYVKNGVKKQYFMKQGGTMAMIDCRYHAPDGCQLGWTAYPQPWLRCYQKNFTLNGKPYIIGNNKPKNTVIIPNSSSLLPTEAPPFLDISRHEATLLTSRDTLTLQAGEPVMWHVDTCCDKLVDIHNIDDSTIRIIPTNNSNYAKDICIEATTSDGRVAACQLYVLPSELPPPTFLREPKIVVHDNTAEPEVRDITAEISYELDISNGLDDESEIVWYRSLLPVGRDSLEMIAVSTGKTYQLSEADYSHKILTAVRPKHQRSSYGDEQCAMLNVIPQSTKRDIYTLSTDFSTLPLQWQRHVAAGFWTVDGYKPADTAEYEWGFDSSRPMWEYGEGFNGAKGRGLLQAQRGARLMYTPVGNRFGDMHLALYVDPTKTAGQGFASATGQYMDVCIKFDTHTLTGYGLRIERTTKSAKAVDFKLIEYDHGHVIDLTEPVTATCYRTGCTILLDVEGNRLNANVSTTTPKPEGSTLPHSVSLSATIKKTNDGGIAIQHTGSCGESTTMIHQLNATWQKF